MTRDVTYRIDVLRNGVKYSSLSWESGSAPQISVQREAVIHSSLRGTVLPSSEIDMLRDELQPVMSIGGVETPLGIFQMTTAKTKGSTSGKRIDFEAYDRGWRLYNAKTESILHLSAGASYITEVQKLLTSCGIDLVIAAPSNATLQTDREDWPAGTSCLTICNDLLSEINYNPVWFDPAGVCRIEPYQEPSVERVAWEYGTSDMFLPEQHPAPDYTDEEDLFDAPNVFICICSNPDIAEAMTATAVNDNPASRKSTFRRGMRIASVQNVDNIASQEELQVYANRLRNESMMATREIAFSTLAEPGHGVGDVLALMHDDIGGIYIETGWQMTLEAGRLMTHTAKRTVSA